MYEFNNKTLVAVWCYLVPSNVVYPFHGLQVKFREDFNPRAEERPLVFKAELKAAEQNQRPLNNREFNGQLGVLNPRNPWKQKQMSTIEIPFLSGNTYV